MSSKLNSQLYQMSRLFLNLSSSSYESFFPISIQTEAVRECVDGEVGSVIESMDGCLFWEELTGCSVEEGSDRQPRASLHLRHCL